MDGRRREMRKRGKTLNYGGIIDEINEFEVINLKHSSEVFKIKMN
jgi:hypothetical protein